MKDFILTPISDILEAAMMTMNGSVRDISDLPLTKYIFDTVYLRMTGALEQKIHLIAWDFAKNSNKLRYNIFKGDFECVSRSTDKDQVYICIIEELIQLKKEKIFSINRKKLLEKSFNSVYPICKFSPISAVYFEEINFFEEIYKGISSKIKNIDFIDETDALIELLNGKNSSNASKACKQILDFPNGFLKKVHDDHIIKKRNKLAHGLSQFCEKSIHALYHKNAEFDNIFLHFLILEYIDNIFIYLFKSVESLDFK